MVKMVSLTFLCCTALATNAACAQTQMTCAEVAAVFDRGDLRRIRTVLDYEQNQWREMDTVAASAPRP